MIGIIAGAAAGSLFAAYLPSGVLRTVFAWLLLAMGGYQIFSAFKS